MKNVPSSYAPLIEHMKFFIEPEISCSRFFGSACFTEEGIQKYRETNNILDLERTEMGTFIADHLQGGRFIDMPCGSYDEREKNIDFDIYPLSKALGAAEYWEVDVDKNVMKTRIDNLIDVIKDGAYQLAQTVGPKSISNDRASFQDDILGFISKMNIDAMPKAMYISALQPDASFISNEENIRNVALPYLQALYKELARVCKKDDMAILNSSSMLVTGINDMHPMIHPALALPPLGFSLMRRDALDKVHVFVKE